MKSRSMLLLAICAAAFVAPPAAGALYKWLDENGRVVYGDAPPPGAKAERVNAAVPPADPNAVRDLAEKDAQLRKQQQQRAEDAAKEEKNIAEQNLMRRQCQQAAVRVKALRQDANVYTYDEKGDKVPLTAAAREEAVAQNQKLMRDLGCTPAMAQ